MTEYIQGVCNKLSIFHGIIAILGIAVAFVYGLSLSLAIDLAETDEDLKKIKRTFIFALGITLYNVLLFIFIPTFEH